MSNPSNQLATESHFYRNHQSSINDVECQHDKPRSSRLRRLILPTTFALLVLVLLIGLLVLNCLRDGHFSGLELDELLPRDFGNSSTTAIFVAVPIAAVLLLIGLCCFLYGPCRPKTEAEKQAEEEKKAEEERKAEEEKRIEQEKLASFQHPQLYQYVWPTTPALTWQPGSWLPNPVYQT